MLFLNLQVVLPNLEGKQKQFRRHLIARFREYILQEFLKLLLICQIFHENLRVFQRYCPVKVLQVTHELGWGLYEDAFFGKNSLVGEVFVLLQRAFENLVNIILDIKIKGFHMLLHKIPLKTQFLTLDFWLVYGKGLFLRLLTIYGFDVIWIFDLAWKESGVILLILSFQEGEIFDFGKEWKGIRHCKINYLLLRRGFYMLLNSSLYLSSL